MIWVENETIKQALREAIMRREEDLERFRMQLNRILEEEQMRHAEMMRQMQNRE